MKFPRGEACFAQTRRARSFIYFFPRRSPKTAFRCVPPTTLPQESSLPSLPPQDSPPQRASGSGTLNLSRRTSRRRAGCSRILGDRRKSYVGKLMIQSRNIILYYTLLYHYILYYATLYFIMLYYIILYYTKAPPCGSLEGAAVVMPCYIVLYHAI